MAESWRDKVLQIGNLVLELHTGRAFWNSAEVHLTVGEFNIVRLLACSVGQHVTYLEIYGFIAGNGKGDHRANVRSAIKRIRHKFEALDPTFDRIQNYTSFGYNWATD